jgi:hypothetical protein
MASSRKSHYSIVSSLRLWPVRGVRLLRSIRSCRRRTNPAIRESRKSYRRRVQLAGSMCVRVRRAGGRARDRTHKRSEIRRPPDRTRSSSGLDVPRRSVPLERTPLHPSCRPRIRIAQLAQPRLLSIVSLRSSSSDVMANSGGIWTGLLKWSLAQPSVENRQAHTTHRQTALCDDTGTHVRLDRR